jgi:transposase
MLATTESGSSHGRLLLSREVVAQTGASGGFKDDPGMAQNFIGSDREQAFLLPPDVREWLPEGHLAWFVIDAVAAMDLSAFYSAYRSDGHGRAAYEPSLMVTLVFYAYARGIRSSRAIERACEEDVAFLVIAAQQRPDHATIARFVERHQEALAGLFGAVLELCAEAGLAKVGVVAVDGTKVHANASRDATSGYEQIAREVLEEAQATDAAEDELYGDAEATSCPRSSPRSTGGADGCAMRSSASMSGGPVRPSRSHAPIPKGTPTAPATPLEQSRGDLWCRGVRIRNVLRPISSDPSFPPPRRRRACPS